LRWPSWCRIDSLFLGVIEAYRKATGGHFNKIVAANGRLLKNINEYESALENESFLTTKLLGPTQYWLTRLGGLGNEKAYVGKEGWLFYRPGVDYVIGPGFLDPAVLARRAARGTEYTQPPRPDPRPAILEFQARLAHSGVRLVLMPAPTKSMIEPERLSPRFGDQLEVLQNPSFRQFAAQMEAAGVLVFDPAPVLIERKQETGRPQFLKTDTHWTPDAVQAVAERLSRFIAGRAPLPARPARFYQTRRSTIINLGDIAGLLKLPASQGLFPAEEVTVRQVLEPDGRPWSPSLKADVLLLGDSFTNIYSMAALEWGESAGFAEQLSVALGRPVDRIAQNDDGAYATRQALARELARGKDRLAGKRVVIWEFAVRELAVGDWKTISWPEARADGPVNPPGRAPSDSGRLQVRGRIKAIARVPEPGRVPYRDAIVSFHLGAIESLQGAVNHPEIVVYLWGMRDNRLTPAARYQTGQRVTLDLTPWEQAQGRYGRFARVELDDPELKLIDLPTFWADEAP
jgi:alginate O-acetyltransferase complex protein AlgJ